MNRHDPDQAGKRQVPIVITNDVFSKLIKLGRADGMTPARMAQALFEEAYAARCLGKSARQQAAAEPSETRPSEADGELAEQLRQRLADSGRLLGQAEIATAQERQAHEATRTALAEARRERDELSRRCWNAEAELERLRAAPVPVTVDEPDGAGPLPAAMLALVRAGAPILSPPAVVGPAEIEAAAHAAIAELADEPLPEPEPAPPPIGRGTVKAVLAMRGMGATAGEIAKDLALRREIVDQVLRESV
jgi:hypothetical protein